ncbi:hypothetical protein K9M42_03065 [Patescibacteria group bacterium]|nr:hypothetical protein [Patescibacteria group bacterium]
MIYNNLLKKSFSYQKKLAKRTKRIYIFDKDSNFSAFKTLIKINFPNLTGLNRKNLFIISKNQKLQEKFLGDYNSFKKNANTFEALDFFIIDILLKFPGKMRVRSSCFKNVFTLTSYYNSNNRNIIVKMVILLGFFRKETYFFEKSLKGEIFKKIDYLKQKEIIN